eukprot:comp21045_c0_seq1/m.44211 comp21045_c0_seq1/g.44211  ORF comp21045_c0_seq1/g.44211 comp21045_c0_seq1/m.44211 type:complete len:343 (+) comp21045_c0_seq1:27-1055(+)
MSSSTRIPVSATLRTQFDHATKATETRSIRILIENEELVPAGSQNATGSVEADFSSLVAGFKHDEPIYAAFNYQPDTPHKWLLIVFVPAISKIKSRMLYGATRETLKKELGGEHFFSEFFADAAADLSWAALQAHLTKVAYSAPVTEKELHKKRADELEAQERNRAAGAGMSSGSVPFQLTTAANGAVADLKSGKAANVQLFLDPATESFDLAGTPSTPLSSIGSALKGDRPLYHLVLVPLEGAKHLVFIYFCPESAPVKHKMLASTGKATLIKLLASLDLNVVKSLECRESADISENDIIAELESALGTSSQSADSPSIGASRIARPSRPGKGGARLVKKE